MSQIVVTDITVFVPRLAFASRWVDMTVSVRVEDVSRPEQPGKGSGNRWMFEYSTYVRYSWQNVVTWIALFVEYFINLFANAFVKSRWVISLYCQVAGDNEVLHLLICQQFTIFQNVPLAI